MQRKRYRKVVAEWSRSCDPRSWVIRLSGAAAGNPIELKDAIDSLAKTRIEAPVAGWQEHYNYTGMCVEAIAAASIETLSRVTDSWPKPIAIDWSQGYDAATDRYLEGWRRAIPHLAQQGEIDYEAIYCKQFGDRLTLNTLADLFFRVSLSTPVTLDDAIDALGQAGHKLYEIARWNQQLAVSGQIGVDDLERLSKTHPSGRLSDSVSLIRGHEMHLTQDACDFVRDSAIAEAEQSSGSIAALVATLSRRFDGDPDEFPLPEVIVKKIETMLGDPIERDRWYPVALAFLSSEWSSNFIY